MTQHHADVAIVGAGILGLAHAYLAARNGLSVVVFERSPHASGASIRNFGMIWPIGQPLGPMRDLALRSRQLWLELLAAASIPYFPTGSLHLAYRDDEADVAREFASLASAQGYPCAWLKPLAALERSEAINPAGLLGALWSESELTVDPRVTLRRIPLYLAERFPIQFRWNAAVRRIDPPFCETPEERWHVQHIIVCGGDDLQTLFPEILSQSGITRCKLQMMRTVPQPKGFRLGPALAAGLTLRFYSSFAACPSLPKLAARIAAESPEYDRYGIHVMASETLSGEITIGDSHEYSLAIDIFDNPEIDRLILDYLRKFLRLPAPQIAQRWHGVYAKHPHRPYFTASPHPAVRIVTAPGGAGMTLSFGLAEQTFTNWENA